MKSIERRFWCSFKKGNQMMRKVFMFVLALGLGVFAAGALAQTSTTGSIEGQVNDPNGAAVKGATVIVTSPNLISAQTATTSDDGRFQILNLPPGTYKVTVEASGFAKYEKNDVAVNLGRTKTAEAPLALGTATTTVNITGGAAGGLPPTTDGA